MSASMSVSESLSVCLFPGLCIYIRIGAFVLQASTYRDIELLRQRTELYCSVPMLCFTDAMRHRYLAQSISIVCFNQLATTMCRCTAKNETTNHQRILGISTIMACSGLRVAHVSWLTCAFEFMLRSMCYTSYQ